MDFISFYTYNILIRYLKVEKPSEELLVRTRRQNNRNVWGFKRSERSRVEVSECWENKFQWSSDASRMDAKAIGVGSIRDSGKADMLAHRHSRADNNHANGKIHGNLFCLNNKLHEKPRKFMHISWKFLSFVSPLYYRMFSFRRRSHLPIHSSISLLHTRTRLSTFIYTDETRRDLRL